MDETTLDRRDFLKVMTAGIGGLMLAFDLPLGHAASPEVGEPEDSPGAHVTSWLHITRSGDVTIYVGKAEMGQGVMTALPTIVADEAEVDWKRVSVKFGPASAPFIDPDVPYTGGSTSVRTGFFHLRQAGAAAREMLLEAAAERWGVPITACMAKEGRVTNLKTGKSLGYGEIADAASKLPIPKNPKLKAERDFTLIGKPVKRKDMHVKVTGQAVFGIDAVVPGMAYAAIRMCPVFGGKLKSAKPLERETASETQVIPLEDAVAVVGPSWWEAKRAVEKLDVRFEEGPNAELSTEKISRMLSDGLSRKGRDVHVEGDAPKALEKATKRLSAEYEVPFLAHATMEPMACAARVLDSECDIWAPTQSPFECQETASKLLGIPSSSVRVHSTFLGGGFGRKAEMDFVAQTVRVAQKAKRPVTLIWSREDDMRHDFYRPAYKARFEGGLDAKGNALAWVFHSAGDSIMIRWYPEKVAGKVDPSSVDGAKDIHYAIPNQKISHERVSTGIPVGFWRSVGNSINAFFVESFIDELAHAAGRDPFQYRRELLEKKPRHRAVLEAAAKLGHWGKPVGKNQGRGIALAESFGSMVAQTALVEVKGNEVKVLEVACAIDLGSVVNPSIVEAQMQSGVVFGLSAALMGEVTIEKGRVVQSNFDDYPVLRMADMPKVSVEILQGGEPMGGVGEPGVPPAAPALTNAIFAATGKRIRRLPVLKALTV